MQVKRTATIVGAAAALAAWLAAAATSGRREIVELHSTKSSSLDKRGAALADEISRLHEQLRPTVRPQEPGRNLFSFSPRPRVELPTVLSTPVLREMPAGSPARPLLKLSGIAEDAAPDGPVRTAIISAFGQLFLVKEGENVTERYRVARISSDVVELIDLADGTTFRLALR